MSGWRNVMNDNQREERQLKFQFRTCLSLIIAGILLLFLGFLVDPLGVIDNSVLVAFGEIATFAGSLIGLDYNYKIKKNRDKDNK